MPKIIHGTAPESTSSVSADRFTALERRIEQLAGAVHQLARETQDNRKPNPVSNPAALMQTLYTEQKKENQKLREENNRLSDPLSQVDRLAQLQQIMPEQQSSTAMDTLLAIVGGVIANQMDSDEPPHGSEPPTENDDPGDAE